VAGIFICYRREDSQAWAGRLYDTLRGVFGRNQVFRDIDTLEPGADYTDAIERWLAESDVMLVVIGPRWLTAAGRNGERRLDDPADLTRLEAATALRRGLRVVPVLVGGAAMPAENELPEELRGLARRHSHELNERRWDFDQEQLVRAIRGVLRAADRSRRGPARRRIAVVVGLVTIILVGGATVYQASNSIFSSFLTLQQRLAAAWPSDPPDEPPSPAAQSRPPGELAQVEPSKAAPDGQPSHKPGGPFRDCAECPEMVVVPPGEFMMGSSDREVGADTDEGPQHKVRIAQPFALGRFEVTFEEWDACVAGGGCGGYRPDDTGWGRGRQPVINVSWNDAKTYARWLSGKSGQTYRLPSEAEWEYATRTGTTTPFWTGATISTEQANYDGTVNRYGPNGENRQRTVAAGSLPANLWGLHEVHGNVWEWVEDCYQDRYKYTPADGSPWVLGGCLSRVVRGGSWYDFPQYLRAAGRVHFAPEFRSKGTGLRVARMLTP
jgi:formylglycine-generating enzyme required for sulfatase activity